MSAPDWSDLLPLTVDRAAPEPIFRQIYAGLRDAILSGALPAGARLPPTRRLAARLEVARSSVVAVYEQLLAEGHAEGRTGAGTYVTRGAIEPGPEISPAPADAHRLPPGVAHYAALRPDPLQFSEAAFNTGRCSVDPRTLRVWRQLSAAQLRRPDAAWLGYADPRGSPRLRAAVAAYLRAARGVRCDPANILILSGTQQAIDLAVRVLVSPGDPVWIEDPAYPALHAALRAARAQVVPVPVDREGLVVQAGIAASPQARAAYVTPSHQSPSGVVLSMPRRLGLLAWARDARAWIIEDDYDSEFRYAGRPLASLQGIDRDERVIYLGTFSKVIFPGLRLGYAVVPPELLDAFVGARYLSDRQAPGLTESVLAEFIEQGHFGAHLRRMCAQYRLARDTLAEALRDRVGDVVRVGVPEQGMHLTAHLPPGLDDRAVARAALAQGVIVRPLRAFAIAAAPPPALILGFSGFTPHALRQGVERLAPVLRAAGA